MESGKLDIFSFDERSPVLNATYSIFPRGSLTLQFYSDRRYAGKGFAMSARFINQDFQSETSVPKPPRPTFPPEFENIIMCSFNFSEIPLDCSGRKYRIMTNNPYGNLQNCQLKFSPKYQQRGVIIKNGMFTRMDD